MLARQAVTGEEPAPGSRLARHVAACPDCARTRQELRGLACELYHAPSAPALSPAFDALTKARLRSALAASPRSAFGPTAWALSLGVTAALTGWLLWPRPLPAKNHCQRKLWE